MCTSSYVLVLLKGFGVSSVRFVRCIKIVVQRDAMCARSHLVDGDRGGRQGAKEQGMCKVISKAGWWAGMCICAERVFAVTFQTVLSVFDLVDHSERLSCLWRRPDTQSCARLCYQCDDCGTDQN